MFMYSDKASQCARTPCTYLLGTFMRCCVESPLRPHALHARASRVSLNEESHYDIQIYNIICVCFQNRLNGDWRQPRNKWITNNDYLHSRGRQKSSSYPKLCLSRSRVSTVVCFPYSLYVFNACRPIFNVSFFWQKSNQIKSNQIKVNGKFKTGYRLVPTSSLK